MFLLVGKGSNSAPSVWEENARTIVLIPSSRIFSANLQKDFAHLLQAFSCFMVGSCHQEVLLGLTAILNELGCGKFLDSLLSLVNLISSSYI